MDCSIIDKTQFCDIAINKVAFPFLQRFFLPVSDNIDSATLYAKISIGAGGLLTFLLSIYVISLIIKGLIKIIPKIIRHVINMIEIRRILKN